MNYTALEIGAGLEAIQATVTYVLYPRIFPQSGPPRLIFALFAPAYGLLAGLGLGVSKLVSLFKKK